MEPEAKKEANAFLPVLPRLDRLDRLMQLLEEKHSLSGRTCSKQPQVKSSEVAQFKPLSNALEEVHHKGTLIDRLEFLEKRLLQLSIEMDEGNTSRSSSSTLPVYEKLGQSSCLSSVTKNESVDGTRDEISAAESESRSKKRKQKRKGNRKWHGWFALGCT